MASSVATAVSSSITTAIAAAVPVLRKCCVREAGSISCHGGKGQDKPKACGTDQRGDFHVRVLFMAGHRLRRAAVPANRYALQYCRNLGFLFHSDLCTGHSDHSPIDRDRWSLIVWTGRRAHVGETGASRGHGGHLALTVAMKDWEMSADNAHSADRP